MLAVAVTALVAVPMSASAVTSSYFVSFDSQRYVARGNAIWQSGGVQIGGTLTAPVGECAQVVFQNFGSSGTESRSVCDGTRSYGFTMSSPTAVELDVILRVQQDDGTFFEVGADRCFPDSTSCQSA